MDQTPGANVIDLSKRSLKVIDRDWRDDITVESLVLDENDLSSLESIQPLPFLIYLSAAKNKIRRMSSLPPLTSLCSLDLSNNSIICIEGLKNLKLLKHLNLSGNHIKIIDHLNNNIALEYVDLSDNAIGHITDLSFLLNLKELYLHKNHISQLKNCEKNFPKSIEILTLSDNNICDLAEVSHLEGLPNLRELGFKGNPCLESAESKHGFSYRPYLKIWCLGLTAVDGVPLDPMECLKGEWLYSQGRGRRFHPGEHNALLEYLKTASPLPEEKKLRLILSKAEHHQQQLKQQFASGIPGSATTRMVSSYHDTVSRDSLCASPDIMARSFDVSVLRNFSPPPQPHKVSDSSNRGHPPLPQDITKGRSGSPLQAASTLIPVPESLISPDVCRQLHPLMSQSSSRNTRSPLATPPNKTSSPQSTPVTRRRVLQSPSPGRKAPSPLSSPKSTPIKRSGSGRRPAASESDVADNEDSEISAVKLHNIQLRASQKRHNHSQPAPVCDRTGIAFEKKAKVANRSPVHAPSSEVWRAALCIQRRWRGYRTRNLNPKVISTYRTIQANRMQDYIIKVSEDMEATKVAIEGNRKLQVLQMQAINAMWRKMSNSEVDGLAASCVHLTKQVEELRSLVSGLQASSGSNPAVPIATQTDIIAVHTPQGDAVFPYPTKRPSQLLITESSTKDSEYDNTAVIPLDDSVCWTPACQEGKDLESLRNMCPGESGDCQK